MSLSKILKREYEVAFTRNAQPLWLRVGKYALIVVPGIFWWQSQWYWIILSALLILSLCIHFWYRYKTKAWTESFGGWDFEKNKPEE